MKKYLLFVMCGMVALPLLMQAAESKLKYKDEAIRAEMAGKWDKAAAIHRIHAAEEPTRGDIWLRIADIEAKLGNTEKIVEAVNKAAEVRPTSHATQFRLSQSYSMANQPTNALAAIERAVELSPGSVQYLRARAQLANWVGRSEVAADSAERILELQPDNSEALLTLARAQSWMGRLDASVRSYRRFIETRSDDWKTIMEAAAVESWRGNYDTALDMLDDAAKKGADGKSIKREKAKMLAAGGKPDAAMEMISKLLLANPKDYEIHYAAALALRNGWRYPDARNEVAELARLRPDSVETAGMRTTVEASLQPYVEAGVRYYDDSDNLKITTMRGRAEVAATAETRVSGAVVFDRLMAERGSGLENADGGREALHHRAEIGLEHVLSGWLTAEGSIGVAVAESNRMASFLVACDIKASDSLSLRGAVDRDYVSISARTVSLDIRRTAARASLEWNPGFLYTVPLSGGYGDFSDGNSYWECSLAPRRAVLRSQWINMDLGLRASGFGYDSNLENGYYDPNLYQQYGIVAVSYIKLTRESGISLIAGAGEYRDDTMSGFDFGWSADAEYTAGALSGWMLKLAGGAVENLRETTSSAFTAYSGSLSLMRRF